MNRVSEEECQETRKGIKCGQQRRGKSRRASRREGEWEIEVDSGSRGDTRPREIEEDMQN